MIVLILLAFNWLSSRYNLKSQLSKVSGEVWLGTITAIANDIQKKKADLEPDRPDDPGKVPLDCKSLDDSTEVNQC